MTSIQDLLKRIKGKEALHLGRLRVIPDDLFVGLIIILVAFGSFGLGRLSKIEGSKVPVRFENVPEMTAETFSQKEPRAITSNQSASVIGATENQLVGSKNGTKYYYSWCTGVQKISQANLIHFASKEEAEARGYTPSSTCKGL